MKTNNAETTTKLVAVLKSVVDRLEGVENDLASLRAMQEANEASPPSEEMTPDEEFDALSAEQTDEERIMSALRALIGEGKLSPSAKVVPPTKGFNAPKGVGKIDALDWTPLPARPKNLASSSKKTKRAWWDKRNALLRADIGVLRAHPGMLIGKRGKPVLNLPEEVKEMLATKHGCGAKNVGIREGEVRRAA